MRLFLLGCLLILSLSFLYSQDFSRPTRILKITIEGAKYISIQTYQYYIQSKEGDIYDEQKLKNDLMRLWKTDFFLDIKIKKEETPDGMIITFIVKEKPKIKEILYVGQKKLSISEIQKKLEESRSDLKPEDYFDPMRVKKIESAIIDILKEKGFRLASVKNEITYLTDNYVKIKFEIDEGESLRIGKIEFEGNKVFSDKKLKKAMKNIKEHSFFKSWIIKKDKLETEKLDEDIENIKEFYFNKGFINIKVGEPKIETYNTKSTILRKPIKRLKLTFPIEEGDSFKFGKITIKDNKVLSEDKLKKLAPFKEGDTFSRVKVRNFIQTIQEQYGEHGYLFASAQPIPDINNEKKIVDLKFQIIEDYPQYIRKIEFKGNTFTYDKVLRREMKIQEGDLVKISLLRKSFERLYRTGFFENIEPDINKVANDNKKIDLAIKVTENKRNEVRFGGGYSQYEKFFGTIAFSTRNLFGTGKIFDFNLQNGSRASLYQIGITDPYFLDYDYTLGITLSKSNLEYFIFDRDSVGGTILFGFPIYEEVRSLLAYGYEVINISNIASEQTQNEETIKFYNALYGTGTKRRQSRFMPQIYRTTLNNPFDPTSGSNISLSVAIAGGILGGNVNLVKPLLKVSQFIPVNRRPDVFAYNFEIGFAQGFGGKDLPVFERFFLGGEYSIRGYDVRTVGPIDPQISRYYTVGGNKYIQFNVEYQIFIAGPVKLAAFLDGGNAFAAGQKLDLTDLRYSTGAELRIMAPFFNAPIRFIYAINFNTGLLTVDRSTFRFAIGRTF